VVITRPRYVADTRAFVASLIVDHTDPYFFDHPCDHVPGMLLLEGCAQLALSAFAEAHSLPPGSSGVAAYDVDFAQFVECGIPVTLTAHVKADRVVRISISQQNVVSGTTTMSIAFPI
jgi:3-hydroxymyristoyl/3-hydroxydecanoyl-(acyl carrier protein) dehydratase